MGLRHRLEDGKARVTGNQVVRPDKADLSRRFRRHPTRAEHAAWKLLRNRGIHGLKFRRQQVIQGFIVDFYCAELKLSLEIDGSIHQETVQAEYDEARSQVLRQHGINVIRLNNSEISRTTLEWILKSPRAVR